jgi:plastocyanin
MRFRTLIAALAAFAAVTSVTAIAGCSSNKTTNPPTTTPESFDSGNLTGTPFTHPFMTQGTFGYHCKYHFGAPYYMVGTVVVDPTSANTSANVNVSSFSFNPASVTVKTGSTVTWTLLGGTHTVTRP